MTTSLYTLQQDLTDVLNDNRDEICGDVYPSDQLHSYVDSIIPVYYSQLANCLAADPGLGFPSDEGLLPDNPTVWQIIQTTLYEELSNHAHDWLEDAQEEYTAEQEAA